MTVLFCAGGHTAQFITKNTLYRFLVYMLRPKKHSDAHSKKDNSRNNQCDIDAGGDTSESNNDAAAPEMLMNVARPELLYFVQETCISFYLLFITIWL